MARINAACYLDDEEPVITLYGGPLPGASIRTEHGYVVFYGSLPQLRRLGLELHSKAVQAEALLEVDELARRQDEQDMAEASADRAEAGF